jgi:hypothetical protein
LVGVEVLLKTPSWLRDEVAKQHGKSWVLLCFAVALFFGALVRTFLSPEQVTRLVRSELSQLKVDNASADLSGLDFSSAAVYFSRGWIPEIGLEVTGLHWNPVRTRCRAQEHPPVFADTVHIPLRFLSLLRGEIESIVVRISRLNLDVDAVKGCPEESRVASRSENLEMAPGTGVVVATREIKKKDFQPSKLLPDAEWSAVLKAIHSIEIQHLETGFESNSKKLALKKLSIVRRENGFSVVTALQIPPATVFGETLPVFRISGVIENEKLTSSIKAELAEGVLSADSNFQVVGNPESGERALLSAVRVAVKDLPLSQLSPLLKRSGLLGEPVNPRSVWLSCHGEISGLFQTMVATQPVELKDCQIYGKLGQIQFDSGARMPSGEFQIDQFSLTDLNLTALNTIFPKAERPALLRYVIDPGVLNGTGRMDGRGLQELKLTLNGVRINPRNSAPTIHSVLSFPQFELTFKRDSVRKNRYLFEVSKILFEQGEIGGALAGAVEAQAESSPRVEFSVKSFALKPKSARELLGVEFGVAKELSGYFVLGFLGVESFAWAAQVTNVNPRGLAEIQHASVKAEHLSPNTSGGASGAQVSLQMDDLTVDRDTWLDAVLRPASIGLWDDGTESVAFSKSQLDLEWVQDRIRVVAFKGSVAKPNVVVSGNGDLYTNSGDLDLNLRFDFPKAKELTWKVSGSAVPYFRKSEGLKLTFRPSSRQLQRLLQKSAASERPTRVSFADLSFDQLQALNTPEIHRKLGLVRDSSVRP